MDVFGDKDCLISVPFWRNIGTCFPGQTSIDIFKIGCDKSQAVKEQEGTTIYFGDHCHPGGNDYSSAMASTNFHHITHGYKETWKILKKVYKTG